MDIKHYEIKQNDGLAWYGLKRVGCPSTITSQIRQERETASEYGLFSERECEVDCFLSVLEATKKKCFTLIDLGAGWGEWMLALVGTVKNKIVPLEIYCTYVVSVECDKKFSRLANENLISNSINGKVINAAVGERLGETRVNIGKISEKYCGSSLSFNGYFSDSQVLARLSGIYHSLCGKTDKVQMISIDNIVSQHLKTSPDMVIMDIQGAEILALKGAKNSLPYIDYLMIGTHGKSVHHKVAKMLEDKYEIVVNAEPDGVTEVNAGYRVMCLKGQDGILLCKRK